MGRVCANVSGTSAEYGDWEYDYIKDGKDKSYYEVKTFEVNLENGDRKWIVNAPIENFVDIVKVKTKYRIEHNREKTLHKWLYNYLKNRGTKIVGYVKVNVNYSGIDYDKHGNREEPVIEGYYLQSDIGDENIVLGLEPKTHVIEKYEDYDWLRLRFMYTYL